MTDLLTLGTLSEKLQSLETDIRVAVESGSIPAAAPVLLEVVVPPDGSEPQSNYVKLGKHVGIALIASAGTSESLGREVPNFRTGVPR